MSQVIATIGSSQAPRQRDILLLVSAFSLMWIRPVNFPLYNHMSLKTN